MEVSNDVEMIEENVDKSENKSTSNDKTKDRGHIPWYVKIIAL